MRLKGESFHPEGPGTAVKLLFLWTAVPWCLLDIHLCNMSLLDAYSNKNCSMTWGLVLHKIGENPVSHSTSILLTPELHILRTDIVDLGHFEIYNCISFNALAIRKSSDLLASGQSNCIWSHSMPIYQLTFFLYSISLYPNFFMGFGATLISLKMKQQIKFKSKAILILISY